MLKTAKGGRKHRSAVSFCCDSSFAAPRGGRDANPPADYDVNPISTRAPRTGRDERAPHRAWGLPISILARRAGRDAPGMDYKLDRCKFQSARLVWGATDYAQTAKGRPLFQSTRPVRGATTAIHVERAKNLF